MIYSASFWTLSFVDFLTLVEYNKTAVKWYSYLLTIYAECFICILSNLATGVYGVYSVLGSLCCPQTMLTSPGIIYHTQTTDSCYMCYILSYKLYNNLLFVKLNFKTSQGANIATQYLSMT